MRGDSLECNLVTGAAEVVTVDVHGPVALLCPSQLETVATSIPADSRWGVAEIVDTEADAECLPVEEALDIGAVESPGDTACGEQSVGCLAADVTLDHVS